ncbi:MAG: hypothetical protein ABJA80_03135 [bacterium]
MRHALVASLLLASACAANKPPKGIRPELLGTYRFEEQVAPDVRIAGTFTVTQDTVDIEAQPGPCRYEQDRSNSLRIVYACGPELTFTFDRTDPVRRATYTTVVHVTEQVSVCLRYTKAASGQMVCAEYGKETRFRDVRRSGLLRPERVDDAG